MLVDDRAAAWRRRAPPLAPMRAADARAAVEAIAAKAVAGRSPRRAGAARRTSLPAPTPSSGSATASTTAAAPRSARALAERGELALSDRRTGTDRPLLLAAGEPRGASDLAVVVALAAGARAAPLRGARAAARTAACWRASAVTLEPGADDRRGRCCRCRASCATASPGSRSKASNRPARCCCSTSAGAAARSAIVAPARRSAGEPLLSENYYLERALAPFTEVRRGRRAGSAEARARGAGLCRCGPGFADRGRGDRQMDRGRRRCCCALPGRISPKQSDDLLPVRLRRGGRTIGGALSWEQPAQARALCPRQPVRRARDPERRHRVAPGAGRADARSRGQDLGAARRRHAARHRRKARARLDRAGPHDGQCRTGRTSRSPGSSSRCCGGSWR